MGQTTFELDSVRHCWEIEDSGTGGEEVSCVVEGMETYQITVQDTQEDFTTDGEDSEVYCQEEVLIVME